MDHDGGFTVSSHVRHDFERDGYIVVKSQSPLLFLLKNGFQTSSSSHPSIFLFVHPPITHLAGLLTAPEMNKIKDALENDDAIRYLITLLLFAAHVRVY